MEEKNRKYTAADFARYHAGTMSRGEMHALEKAALEDPFLEDALEGYIHSRNAKRDIEDLKFRLAEKEKRKNVFFISSPAQNKWWRVAALFIIVAGSGYLFYRLNFVKKENSFAQNSVKSSPEKADSPALLKPEIEITRTDSSKKSNDIVFENQPALESVQKEKAALPRVTPPLNKETVASGKKAEMEVAQNYKSALKDSLYTSGAPDEKVSKESNSRTASGYILKGKVTDGSGVAVPFATITDRSHKRGTFADAEGSFLLLSKDSSITATASAPGFDTKTFLLKKDVQPTIAMNKSKAELSEVEITAYGSRKRKQAKASAPDSDSLGGEAAGFQITPNGPQPAGGQEKFNQYLKENALPVYDENNERLTGKVLLSFIINKKGRPVNIKVVRSSCKACEDEAIDLLKNGPDWIGTKDTSVTVTMNF